MKNPCKDCVDRKVGCHAVCNKYLDWRTNRLDWLEIVQANKAKERKLNDHRDDTFRKIRKSH